MSSAALAARVAPVCEALGREMLRWLGEGRTAGHWEESQFKADADQWAHDFYLGHLSTLLDVPILSEEDVIDTSVARPQCYWLIDPIDGTRSYCEGYEGYVTQVALIEDGKVQLGVIHAPASNTTWHAARGAGAWKNRELLKKVASGTPQSMVDNYPQPRGVAKVLFDSMGLSQYIESGSLGLKLALVGDGSADLFVKDVTVRDWDLAPAHVLLEETGCTLVDVSGQPITYEGSFEKHGLIAATGQDVVDSVLLRLKDHTEDSGAPA